MVINVIVNTNDSYKSFKDSNNWNQDLKIKGEILKYFSENVPQLWTKATLLKTIKQLELHYRKPADQIMNIFSKNV